MKNERENVYAEDEPGKDARMSASAEEESMKNDMKKTTIITTAVCLIPVLAGILLYSRLPEMIVTHWDSMGEPNGWQTKFVGAIVFPGILALLNISMPFLMKADPKYSNMSAKVKHLIQWIIPVVCLFCSSTTLAEGLGYDSKVKITAPFFVGLLFVLIGNYLPKARQTFTVGIRLPWTLADEENWNRTHRMAGFLWVVCGILMMLTAFLRTKRMVFVVLFGVMILIPTGYSYILFRRKHRTE